MQNEIQEDTPDRNKTEITLRVTEAAAVWLKEIGAKAIETEVYICSGWVADLAAFWVPTMTEAVQQKLIPRRPKYPKLDFLVLELNDALSGNREERQYPEEAIKEHKRQYQEWNDKLISVMRRITILCEVKTTRQDFLRDKKWCMPREADIQILIYPKGIITEAEIPDGWWGLEYNEERIKVRKRCPLFDTPAEKKLAVIANLADRQHNRNANALYRALAKKHTLEHSYREKDYRLSRCINALLNIHSFTTIDDWLVYYFGRNHKIRESTIEDLVNFKNRVK